MPSTTASLLLAAMKTRSAPASSPRSNALTAGQQCQHLALAVRQAVRSIEAWHPLAGRLDHGGNGVRIETTCLRLGGEGLRGLLSRHARAVRALLALRVEHVRRGEQPGWHGQLGGGMPRW